MQEEEGDVDVKKQKEKGLNNLHVLILVPFSEHLFK